MEPNSNFNNNSGFNQTSFIPKQALAKTVPPLRRQTSLFTIVAAVILLLSLGLLAGGYGFKQLLLRQINDECRTLSDGVTRVCGLRLSLAAARESLGESVLKQIEKLDIKIKIADRLLREHVILTPIFDRVLSPLTLQSVQYKSLIYDNGIASFEGIARSYKDIAVQANRFADEGMVKSFIFSDLDLDARGNIIFKLKLEFNPSLTRYANYTLINELTAPIVPEPEPPLPPPVTLPSGSNTATSSLATTTSEI